MQKNPVFLLFVMVGELIRGSENALKMETLHF